MPDAKPKLQPKKPEAICNSGIPARPNNRGNNWNRTTECATISIGLKVSIKR